MDKTSSTPTRPRPDDDPLCQALREAVETGPEACIRVIQKHEGAFTQVRRGSKLTLALFSCSSDVV